MTEFNNNYKKKYLELKNASKDELFTAGLLEDPGMHGGGKFKLPKFKVPKKGPKKSGRSSGRSGRGKSSRGKSSRGSGVKPKYNKGRGRNSSRGSSKNSAKKSFFSFGSSGKSSSKGSKSSKGSFFSRMFGKNKKSAKSSKSGSSKSGKKRSKKSQAKIDKKRKARKSEKKAKKEKAKKKKNKKSEKKKLKKEEKRKKKEEKRKKKEEEAEEQRRVTEEAEEEQRRVTEEEQRRIEEAEGSSITSDDLNNLDSDSSDDDDSDSSSDSDSDSSDSDSSSDDDTQFGGSSDGRTDEINNIGIVQPQGSVEQVQGNIEQVQSNVAHEQLATETMINKMVVEREKLENIVLQLHGTTDINEKLIGAVKEEYDKAIAGITEQNKLSIEQIKLLENDNIANMKQDIIAYEEKLSSFIKLSDNTKPLMKKLNKLIKMGDKTIERLIEQNTAGESMVTLLLKQIPTEDKENMSRTDHVSSMAKQGINLASNTGLVNPLQVQAATKVVNVGSQLGNQVENVIEDKPSSWLSPWSQKYTSNNKTDVNYLINKSRKLNNFSDRGNAIGYIVGYESMFGSADDNYDEIFNKYIDTMNIDGENKYDFLMGYSDAHKCGKTDYSNENDTIYNIALIQMQKN